MQESCLPSTLDISTVIHINGRQLLAGGSENGFVAVYESFDLGKAWTRVPGLGFRGSVNSLCVSPSKEVWVAGWQGEREGFICHRNPSGEWAVVNSLPSEDNGEILAIHCGPMQRLVIATRQSIFASEDRLRWKLLLTAPKLQAFGSWSFPRGRHMWIGGEQLLHSEDAGTTWKERALTPAVGGYPQNVCFIDADRGWVAVSKTDGSLETSVYSTVDGGFTWSNEWSGPAYRFLSIPGAILALGDGRIFRRAL